MNKFRLIFFIMFSGLYACAEQSTKTDVLVPVEERHVPSSHSQSYDPVAQPADTNPDIRRDNDSKPEESVIIALLNEADTHANDCNTDKAAATIERALRIEPGNALLWHRFAAIRLQQQQWQQAIALARKSNALIKNNDALKSANWGVIADAYEKLGNQDKAKEARRKQKLQG